MRAQPSKPLPSTLLGVIVGIALGVCAAHAIPDETISAAEDRLFLADHLASGGGTWLFGAGCVSTNNKRWSRSR